MRGQLSFLLAVKFDYTYRERDTLKTSAGRQIYDTYRKLDTLKTHMQKLAREDMMQQMFSEDRSVLWNPVTNNDLLLLDLPSPTPTTTAPNSVNVEMDTKKFLGSKCCLHFLPK